MSGRRKPTSPPDPAQLPCPLPAVSPDDPQALLEIEKTLALYARLLSLLRALKERADGAAKDPRARQRHPDAKSLPFHTECDR